MITKKQRDIEEDILAWIDRPNEDTLAHIGERLQDSGTLGFQDNSITQPNNKSTASRLANEWLENNIRKNIEKYDNINIDSEFELAIHIYSLLEPVFPYVPRIPISVICAKEILEGRSPKSETSAQGEISDPRLILNDDKKFQNAFLMASTAIELGQLLRTERERVGLSQAEVAKSMGTDHRAVRRIEMGETNPSWETTSRFAKALGANIGLIPSQEN